AGEGDADAAVVVRHEADVLRIDSGDVPGENAAEAGGELVCPASHTEPRRSRDQGKRSNQQAEQRARQVDAQVVQGRRRGEEGEPQHVCEPGWAGVLERALPEARLDDL